MIRHASSHGLAVLVCTLTSALLVEMLRGVIPGIYESMVSFSAKVIVQLNLPVEPGVLTTVFVAVVLAVIWGIAFKIAFKR